MSPFIIIASLMAGTQGSPAAGAPFSIDDAVKVADQNAFAILIQRSVVEKQREFVKQNEGKLGPTVDLGATYTRYDEQSSFIIAPNTPAIVTQPIFNSGATATVTLPIDITGNTRRTIKSTKYNLNAQRQTLVATRNDTKQTVRRAYIEVLRAQDNVKVQQEAVTNEQERVRTTQLQFDQGTVAKVDLLKAQTQLAQSQTGVITAQNALTQSKQSLNNTLARPIETDFSVVPISQLPNPSTDADNLTLQAQKQRPEVASLVSIQKALEQVRKADEQGNLPSLSASVEVQQALSNVTFGQRAQSVTGILSLNWPVFDSGQTRAIVKQARQDEEQNRIRLKQQILTVSLDVRQAVTALINARAELKLANETVVEAREALRLAVLKQQAGQGIFLEVLDAQNTLTTSENSQVSALYDYLESVADLQRAYGVDTLPPGSPDDAISIPVSTPPTSGTAPGTSGQGSK